jgi:hypothetical protein
MAYSQTFKRVMIPICCKKNLGDWYTLGSIGNYFSCFSSNHSVFGLLFGTGNDIL